MFSCKNFPSAYLLSVGAYFHCTPRQKETFTHGYG